MDADDQAFASPKTPAVELVSGHGEASQSKGEEIANGITHAIGFLAALAAMPILAVEAVRHGDTWRLVGGLVFAASAALLFASSTIYHAIPHPRAKRVLRVLDHVSIYVLIAGTYTPLTIGVLRGGWGWSLFGVVWTLALFGIVAKTTIGMRFPRASTALYLLMGWLAVVATGPMLRVLSWEQFAWIVAGGLCYTLGVPFYAWKRRRYAHAIWHVFVLGGAVCHFFAVLLSMRISPPA